MFSLTLYIGAHVSPVMFVFKEQDGATQAKATVDAAMLGIGPAEFKTEHSHSVKLADDFGQEGTFKAADIAGCMLQDAERVLEVERIKQRYAFAKQYPNAARPQIATR